MRSREAGTYASSLEQNGAVQPIESAFFGEGMAKADFAAGAIAPPRVTVVPSTMTKLTFSKASVSLPYDVAQIIVFATPDTAAGRRRKQL